MSINPIKVIKSPDTYFETLSDEVRKRYLEKIKIINNCDPFMMKTHELSDNLEELPEKSTMDLVNKSLEAYRFVEAGFVPALEFKKIEGYYAVVVDVSFCNKFYLIKSISWFI